MLRWYYCVGGNYCQFFFFPCLRSPKRPSISSIWRGCQPENFYWSSTSSFSFFLLLLFLLLYLLFFHVRVFWLRLLIIHVTELVRFLSFLASCMWLPLRTCVSFFVLHMPCMCLPSFFVLKTLQQYICICNKWILINRPAFGKCVQLKDCLIKPHVVWSSVAD